MAGLRQVSSFANVESEIPSGEKDHFDWCREGNLDRIKQLATDEPSLLLSKDKNGMTMLHWAADRGHSDMLSYLLQDTNAKHCLDYQDAEGNTALHLAYWSECSACMDILVKFGAKTDIMNGEGERFVDYR